jgi:hypothetical protein
VRAGAAAAKRSRFGSFVRGVLAIVLVAIVAG